MGTIINVHYDFTLVGLSFMISVFGAYTALQLAIAIPRARGNAVFGWIGGAAFAMGGGAIWSMHFIAMIAYEASMSVSYDPKMTLLSLIIAVMATGIGLFVVGRGEPSILKLITGGTFTGLGVAGMHYMGMEAMIMPADISYNTPLLVLSLIIAIIAAIVALWLAFNLRGNLQRFGSAIVMGIAVCGMHYTGMAAAIMTPVNHAVFNVEVAIAPQNLAIYVFVIGTGLLSVLLLISYWRSRQILYYISIK